MSDLPEGYTIKPAAGGLPPGYTIKPSGPAAAPAQGIGDEIWQGIKNFGSGVAAGVEGKGIPEGRASKFAGGRSGFGGRMLGSAARGIGESLWEAIKTPGQYLTGEKQPGPQSPAQGLGTAMLMAGGGPARGLTTEAAEAPSMLAGARGVMGDVRGGGKGIYGGPKTPEQIAQAGGGRVEPLPRPEPTPAPAPEPSTLGSAIAENNPGAVDRAISQQYRQAINPGLKGRKSAPRLDEQDRRIITAIDQIIENKNTLKLTDAAGNAERPGMLPRTLRQFSDSIDQIKSQLFQKYDALARQTGEMGVVIPLSPIVAKYREIGRDPVVASEHPDWAAKLLRKADDLEKIGVETPLQMQKRIKLINGEWRSYYENKMKAQGDVFEPIATMHRELLDSAISNATTPGYQAFKHQYGALRSIEDDVTKAASRELAKKPGLLNRMADVATTHQILMGLATVNPKMLASGAAAQISKHAVRYLNDPNRAIMRMFQRREAMKEVGSPSMGRYGQPPDQGAMGLRMLGSGAAAPSQGGPAMPPLPSRGFPQPPPSPPRRYPDGDYIEPPAREPRHSVGGP